MKHWMLMLRLIWLAVGLLVGSELGAVISQRIGVVILLIILGIAVWDYWKKEV